MRLPSLPVLLASVPLSLLMLTSSACTHTTNNAPSDAMLHAGANALDDDWSGDAPGVRRLIRPSDLPAPALDRPDPESSVASPARVVPRPEGAMLRVPDGFVVQVFATGLKQPRRIRVAPNGDIFVSESGHGRVIVFPAGTLNGTATTSEVFAGNLDRPYGIAFHPPANPTHVYVAAANQVVRYPYRSGMMKASGPAEVIIDSIPTKRHWTRDLAVSADGQRLFVAVGSASNLGVNSMQQKSAAEIREHEARHGRGAAWGEETDRAVVRVFDPAGKTVRNFSTGIRNCSGLATQPGSGDVWCVVNERDHLGPIMVPDFMLRLQDGAFYGWPWYTIGSTEDPALKGQRPDLQNEVRVPEVLIQAHSSALGVAFYDHDAFPAEYRGDAFVALHGSHSRPQMTGYKVIRVRMKDGAATGEIRRLPDRIRHRQQHRLGASRRGRRCK